MAKYQITSPDGGVFEIEAPDDANEQDVMAYAQSQFSGGQQGLPQQEYKPNIGDYLQQMAQGATFNLTDELGSGLAAGKMALDRGNLDSFGEDYQAGLQGVRQEQAEFEKNRPVSSMLMRGAGTLATGAAGAATKTGAAVLNSLRTGSTAARMGKASLVGAASGGFAGFGSGEGSDTAANTVKDAAGGALIGAAIPAAPAALNAIGKTVVPDVEQETAKLAQRAKDLGIDLSLNQVAPSRARNTVQKVSQEMPFSGVGRFEDKQAKQWNKAVARTLGEDADNLGPQTIQSFRKKNSAQFDSAIKGKQFNFTNMVKGDLDAIATEAKSTIDDGLAKVVRENVNHAWNQLKSGNISAEKLTSLRSELLKRTTRMNNGAAPYVSDIIDKIDEIVEAQLPAEARKSLGQARRQYRNFKTVQPLLEKSTNGMINPTQLLDRVASNRYIDASKAALGEDELIDLARIGKQFMPKLGGSDTFQKSALSIGAAGGIGTGALFEPVTALSVAGTLGANRAFQSGVNQNQTLVNLALRNAGKQSGAISIGDTDFMPFSRNIQRIEIRPQQKLPPVNLPSLGKRK